MERLHAFTSVIPRKGSVIPTGSSTFEALPPQSDNRDGDSRSIGSHLGGALEAIIGGANAEGILPIPAAVPLPQTGEACTRFQMAK